MKVLLLAQFLPPVIGGVERHVLALASALAGRGHDVTLLGQAVPADGAGTNPADPPDVRVIRVRSWASRLGFLYTDPVRPHTLPIPDPGLRRAIGDVLAEGGFDVVHAHNWIANSALGPAGAAGVPLVMTLHDYSHVCATGRMMYKGRQLCPGPSMSRCIPCASDHFGPIKGELVLAANAWGARQRCRRVSSFAAVSGAVADAMHAERAGQGLIGATVTAEVIPNFIPDDIVADAVLPVGSDSPLLFVGDVTRDKGVGVLLDAYRRLESPPPLILAGRAQDDLGDIPEGVTVLGTVPHEEVRSLFSSARAVVVPSVWADPCPTVVLEAMANGRPVIASSAGGIIDMVVDGVTGLLVPPGDPEALSDGIAAVLASPATAVSYGEAGHERVRQFTVSAVAERVEQMYERAVAGESAVLSHVG